ncbi:hypothetical protein HDU93_000611 [Gonapodya sp. JEL0774]|nr:hypothetical protein HDU93_000611 [Gonapodya sp. JEL0774]
MGPQLSHAELTALRDEFKSGLEDLTQNVRPLILALTTVAQENQQAAPIIVEAIEDRIRTAPAPQKLPSLYLIDSICKLIGPPYPPLFSRNIVAVFSSAYASVDPETRDRMEKMIGTWGPQRLPGIGGGMTPGVFGKEVIGRLQGVVRGFKEAEWRESEAVGRGNSWTGGFGRAGNSTTTPLPGLGATMGVNWDSSGSGLLPSLSGIGRHPSRSPTPPSFRAFQNRDSPPPMADVGGRSASYDGNAVGRFATGLSSVNNSISGGGGGFRLEVGDSVGRGTGLGTGTGYSAGAGVSITSSSDAGRAGSRGYSGYSSMRMGGIWTELFPPYPYPPQVSRSLEPVVDTGLLDLELRALMEAKSAMARSYPQGRGEGPQLVALEGLYKLLHSNTLDNASLVVIATQIHDVFISTFPSAAATALHPVQVPPPAPTLPPPLPSLPGLPGLGLAGGVPIGVGSVSGIVPGLNGVATPPTVPGLVGSISAAGGAAAALAAVAAAWPGARGTTPTMDTVTDEGGWDKMEKDTTSLPGKERYRVRMTTEDINRWCGFRFLPSEDGKQRYSAHLDWHFRQNRRAREKTRKIVGRDWYLPEDDWVNTRELAAVEEKNPFDGAPGAGGPVGFEKDDLGKKEPEAPQPSIKAPEDDAVIAAGCPICGEKLEKYWDEDGEEWMVRNAVWVDGKVSRSIKQYLPNVFLSITSRNLYALVPHNKVVHAKCNADRIVRLLQQQSSTEHPERSSTPLGSVKMDDRSRGLSPGPGILGKRKADDGMEAGVKKEKI